jgi:hypothetical protein
MIELTESGICCEMEMNGDKIKIKRISRQTSIVEIMIDQKQLENVEYFNNLGNMIADDARCARGIKCRIATPKAAFNRKKTLCTSKLDLNLRKKLVYILSMALYGAEIGTLQKVHHNYLESFELWCWRRMEKIIWTDRVRSEEVLHRVKEDRNIVDTVKRRKDNWIGHILRRNCLIKHIIEEKIEVGQK